MMKVGNKRRVFKSPVAENDPNEQKYKAGKEVNKNTDSAILVVDDNAGIRSYVKRILDKKYHVLEAGTAAEAFDILNNKDLDLIILDIMMPQMSGLEFATQLKKNEKLREMPLITLTGRTDESTRLDALRVGINDVMVKPFNPQELIIRCENRISSYLNQKKSMLEAEPEEEEILSYYDKLIRSIKEEIEKRISDNSLSVTALADFACVSCATLTRILKKQTGLTPGQYIREVRLSRAMELLENKQYATIQQVVFAVGMEDASHFTSMFSRRFGKRPSEIFKT